MFMYALCSQNDVLFQAAGCDCVSSEDKIVRLGGRQGVSDHPVSLSQRWG